MKKTGTEFKIVVNATDIKEAMDVYYAFALAKFDKYLTPAERKLIAEQSVNEYFQNLYDYCESVECDSCEIEGVDGTIKISTKKPNIFKRIWNKLFKRNKA